MTVPSDPVVVVAEMTPSLLVVVPSVLDPEPEPDAVRFWASIGAVLPLGTVSVGRTTPGTLADVAVLTDVPEAGADAGASADEAGAAAAGAAAGSDDVLPELVVVTPAPAGCAVTTVTAELEFALAPLLVLAGVPVAPLVPLDAGGAAAGLTVGFRFVLAGCALLGGVLAGWEVAGTTVRGAPVVGDFGGGFDAVFGAVGTTAGVACVT